MVLLFLTMVMMMTHSLSPLKLSLSMVGVSLLLSLKTYSSLSSVFPACAMALSFASGMMILFCYSSTLSAFEAKSSVKMSLPMLGLLMTIMSLVVSESPSSSTEATCFTSLGGPVFICLMMFLLCCMVVINQSMVDPSKPLSNSY